MDYRARMHSALDRLLDGKKTVEKDGGPGSGPQKGGSHPFHSVAQKYGYKPVSKEVRQEGNNLAGKPQFMTSVKYRHPSGSETSLHTEKGSNAWKDPEFQTHMASTKQRTTHSPEEFEVHLKTKQIPGSKRFTK